ncbi:MAG: ribbon-helix-helix domain-containing protein [Rhodospirillales bacterium]|nr:ribbon-helix-helix domain-containing protein [Rhodospirillales bacterium]
MSAASSEKPISSGDKALGGMDSVSGQKPLDRLFGLCNVEQHQEFESERRSMRLHGHSTTIRLERAYWTVLGILAAEEDITVAALVTRIHDHCQVANDKNLASCLRVVCLKYINICT